MVDQQTHRISGHARPVGRNQYRAECGLLVDGTSDARDGRPSCLECAAFDDEDAQTAQSLSQIQLMTPAQLAEHFGGDPVEIKSADTLAGYRRRK